GNFSYYSKWRRPAVGRAAVAEAREAPAAGQGGHQPTQLETRASVTIHWRTFIIRSGIMRAALLLIGSLLASTAFANGAANPAAAADKGVGDLKAFAEKMNQAFLTLDINYIKGAISDTPWVTWDTDAAGRPTSHSTKADTMKNLEQMDKMLKAMNAKVSF